MKQCYNIFTILYLLIAHTASYTSFQKETPEIPTHKTSQLCDVTEYAGRYNNSSSSIGAMVIWMCRNLNTRSSDGRIIRPDINDPNTLSRWEIGIEKIITPAEKDKHRDRTDIVIKNHNVICTTQNIQISSELEEAVIVASQLKNDSFKSLLPELLQDRMSHFEREIIKPKKTIKPVPDPDPIVLPNVYSDQWPRNHQVQNSKKNKWYNGDATIK